MQSNARERTKENRVVAFFLPHLGKRERKETSTKMDQPKPSAPPMQAHDTANTTSSMPCPCVSTARLGPYPSAREPLKADLDTRGLDSDDESDDSSIDSSDSHHDDDDGGSEADDEFFFGDVDAFMSETESMFQKMRERFPAHHVPSSSSPKVVGGNNHNISMSSSPAQNRTSCPSLADSTMTSSESIEPAMDTSDDTAAVPSTIRGFHSYSTGTSTGKQKSHTSSPKKREERERSSQTHSLS